MGMGKQSATFCARAETALDFLTRHIRVTQDADASSLIIPLSPQEH
jgi:hypothetical protein